MANDSKQESYAKGNGAAAGLSKAVGLGLVSAASAIAGGLAMAWWYRKTLSKLQNPIASGADPVPESGKTKPESE